MRALLSQLARKSRRISLKRMVVLGIVLGVCLPRLSLVSVDVYKARLRLLGEANDDFGRYLELASLAVAGSVWNVDQAEAEKIIAPIFRDERIISLRVLDEKGNPFVEKSLASRKAKETLANAIRIENKGRTIGSVEMSFSLGSANNAIQRMLLVEFVKTILEIIACVGVLLIFIHNRVIHRLLKIGEQANQLAAKKLDEPFVWEKSDEIGDLGNALETTRSALESLFQELEDKNAQLAEVNLNLEKLVQERTATIRMILDNVKSGFLVAGPDMKIQAGYSRSCEELFSNPSLSGISLYDALCLDVRAASNFRVNLAQVFEDFLPEALTLSQIPNRAEVKGRTLSIEGSAVRDREGKVAVILFSIIDVTELIEAQRDSARKSGLLTILQNMSGFRHFVNDFKVGVEDCATSLRGNDMSAVRREIHTLKGNSASFGITDLSKFIHEVESFEQISEQHLGAIEKCFINYLEENYQILRVRYGDEESHEVSIDISSLNLISNDLGSERPDVEKLSLMKTWIDRIRLTSLSQVFTPYTPYVRSMAERRGKQVRLVVEDQGPFIDLSKISNFKASIVHLLRNAVDHGIEEPDRRGKKDKLGTIRVSFQNLADSIIIEVADDGAGINRGKVLAKAEELGLAHERLDGPEIDRLIFIEGFSTSEEITDTSGRGLGINAVIQSVTDLGGNIEVTSKPGAGTCFRIRLPKRAIGWIEANSPVFLTRVS